MNIHTDKSQESKSLSVASDYSKKKSDGSTYQFIDNRPETAAQRKLQEMANNSPQMKQLKAIQEKINNSSQVMQKVSIGTINCPSVGDIPSLGNAIHSRLQADYVANGAAHATWLRGYEFALPTGQRPDISLRTPVANFVRSVGEIKPLAGAAAGAAQIAAHHANIPANGLNAGNPVISDPGWAAGASFPVTNLDVHGVSPSGNVNLTAVAATPGLYTYDG